MNKKQQLTIKEGYTYLIFPLVLTLAIFSFISFTYLDHEKAKGQENPPIAVGYQLEYQQNCLCEWPPFSGRCYGANQCQVNVNTNTLAPIICTVGENQQSGQWQSSCGNGVVDCSEQCDPFAQGANALRSYCDAFFGDQDWYDEEGKSQTCNNNCTWNVTTVYSLESCGGYCGDGVVQSNVESCESDGQGTGENDQYLCQSCQFVGGYCGDGTIQYQLGEMCDPNAENPQAGIECLSDCTVQCDEGFHFEYIAQLGRGSCISNTRACEDESGHGSGTQHWNTEKNVWDVCVAESCDELYRLEEGNCVENRCDIFNHAQNIVTGYGLATYDPETQESGVCENNITCLNTQTHRVFQRQDGRYVCEPKTCVGPTKQICYIENGIGQETRECDEEAHPPTYGDWGSCVTTICDDNYRLIEGDNACYPSACLEPLEEDCTQEIPNSSIAKKSRECIDGQPPVVGEWGSCQLFECADGYRIYENVDQIISCELDHCEGEENIDCTNEKPNAVLALRQGMCQLEEHPPVYGYGSCEIIQCRSGYAHDQQTNTCVEIHYPVVGNAWSVNAGWINMNPNAVQNPNFQSVYIRVSDVAAVHAEMKGYAWNTNIGWINFDGVTVDGQGHLMGFASYTVTLPGEPVMTYQINMSPDCGGHPECGVRIQGNGELTGYAWDQGFGWVLFNPQNGGVTTTFNLFTPEVN